MLRFGMGLQSEIVKFAVFHGFLAKNKAVFKSP